MLLLRDGKNNFKYKLVFWVLERAVSLRRFCLKLFTSSDKQVIFRLEKLCKLILALFS